MMGRTDLEDTECWKLDFGTTHTVSYAFLGARGASEITIASFELWMRALGQDLMGSAWKHELDYVRQLCSFAARTVTL